MDATSWDYAPASIAACDRMHRRGPCLPDRLETALIRKSLLESAGSVESLMEAHTEHGGTPMATICVQRLVSRRVLRC
jgi:hypothetical protein